ncbi:MAG: hypothetical protein GX561_07735 [Lentisphaerae bacterium]|jgi:hypothetical protein|nr:hypothetical protein [Lentisphaerota bacterium]
MNERESLMRFLTELEDLNPDVSLQRLREAESHARLVGSAGFDEVADRVEHLIGLYLSSPPKKLGAETLEEYFGYLNRDAERLLASGELQAGPVVSEGGGSTALVPRQLYGAMDRCIVLNRCTVPQLLSKAADAFRRRNQVVSTVVEIGFRLLWCLDRKLADAWFVGYFRRSEGHLDPDVLRDAISVALEQPGVSREFLEWGMRWCGDFGLLEMWPNVVHKGDRLLCRHAVKSWFAKHKPRTTSLAHLKVMFDLGKYGDEALLDWIRAALGTLGECVLRIMSLGDQAESGDELEVEGYRGALMSELRRLSQLFPVVLFVSDQLLSLPDGCVQLAMAVMGLAGEGLVQWDDGVLEFCRRVIRRTFVYDMRAGRSPLETIDRLTFGDSHAYFRAYAELDLVSERFDSLDQREKVIELLAPYYASYRQPALLAAETTRRYRKLRWLLHEDYLTRVLDSEQMAQVREMEWVWELGAVAGEARRFLGRQRDLSLSVESMIASKIEFEESMRSRRLRAIRRMLGS